MSFRIEIENFQSVVKADLEISGVTTITGQNNSGKSAIMRAIRGAFTNPGNGSSYIHHGTDFFRVKISFDDGKYVMWERIGRRATKGKKKGELIDLKTNYEVNGVTYEGVANSVPDAVLEQGVGPITIGRDLVWPQLAKQVKDVFFLVDKPGSHVAEAVANVDNVAVLNAAIRDCDKDARSVSSELKLRRTDYAGHQDKLEAMKGLDDVVAMVEETEKLHAQVERVQRGLVTVTGIRDRITVATAEVERLAPAMSIVVPPNGRLEEVKDNDQKLRDHHTLRSQLVEAREAAEKLAGAGDLEVPDEHRLQDLRTTSQDLSAAAKLHIRLASAEAVVTRLAPVEALSDLDLDAGMTTLKKVYKGLEVFGGLQTRLYDSRNAAESEKESLHRAEKKVEEIQAELDEFLVDNPKCSECGQYRVKEAS